MPPGLGYARDRTGLPLPPPRVIYISHLRLSLSLSIGFRPVPQPWPHSPTKSLSSLASEGVKCSFRVKTMSSSSPLCALQSPRSARVDSPAFVHELTRILLMHHRRGKVASRILAQRRYYRPSSAPCTRRSTWTLISSKTWQLATYFLQAVAQGELVWLLSTPASRTPPPSTR